MPFLHADKYAAVFLPEYFEASQNYSVAKIIVDFSHPSRFCFGQGLSNRLDERLALPS